MSCKVACLRGSVGKWPLSATHQFLSMRYSLHCNPPKMLLGKVNLRMKYSERGSTQIHLLFLASAMMAFNFRILEGFWMYWLQVPDTSYRYCILAWCGVLNVGHFLLHQWPYKRSIRMFSLWPKQDFKLPWSPWGRLLCWRRWWYSSELSHSGKGYNDAVL